MATTKFPLGIYVHIPFCVKKCDYCDFLSAPGDSKCIREYVFMLISEIRAFCEISKEYSVKTVYFGGGTPSSIDKELISDICTAIGDTFDLSELSEMTIEVNPGTADLQKLAYYRNLGFNRISIGIQSCDNDELRLLGRIHTYEEAEACVRMAREAGFTNLSVDIMSALPGQTLDNYKRNIEKILAMNPEHISSYSLILEEGTRFFEKYGPDGAYKGMIPDEETDREMYAYTKKRLSEAGYERYEISNYARPGYESRHNSSYWTGTDYIGFGLGAASLIDGVRYVNARTFDEYGTCAGAKVFCQSDISTGSRRLEEKLTGKALMQEFMILGLRMTKGVSKNEFKSRFGADITEVYKKEIDKLLREGILSENSDRLFLTDFGLDVSNYAFEQFI